MSTRMMVFLFCLVIGCTITSSCCSSKSAIHDIDVDEQKILNTILDDVQSILSQQSDSDDDPRGELLCQKLCRLQLAVEAAQNEKPSIRICIDPALASLRFRLTSTDRSTGRMPVYVSASLTFRHVLDMLCAVVGAEWRIENRNILYGMLQKHNC